MQDVNMLLLTGRLAKDPKISTGSYGDYALLTIAVNKNAKNHETGQYEEKTSFVSCILGGRKVEKVKEFKKGDLVHGYGPLEVVQKEKNGVWETRATVKLENITRLRKVGTKVAEENEAALEPPQHYAYADNDEVPF